MEQRTMEHSTKNDFDFLFGRWRVHHRRLRERLAGCNEWQEFDGTSVAQPILGGLGNIDDNLLNLPAGCTGPPRFALSTSAPGSGRSGGSMRAILTIRSIR